MNINPLLEITYNTPYGTAPFSKIKEADFLPAFENAIELAKKDIEAITNQTEPATFENTIEALGFSGMVLDRVSSIFFNLNAAETNENIQKIAQRISPLLSEFNNDVKLNKILFQRIKSVYDDKSNLSLDTEQNTLLDKTYKSFSRNGALLSEDKQEELRAIDKNLGQLTLKFGEHVLAETNAFEMHITDEAQLSGLPEDIKTSAKQLAKTKEKEGWVFTLDYPSYIPFITYADDRALRKKITIAAGSKGFKNNAYDNQDIIIQIVTLRKKRAQLLGYTSHAHFVLEERMAETPEKVSSFLNTLLEKAKPVAQREFKNLEAYAKSLDDIDKLEKWDGAYYAEPKG